MSERSADWFHQAQRDLRHARNAAASEDYEWSCFAAQQAAEKALKAVYLREGAEGWGHSVRKLLEGLGARVPAGAGLLEAGARLDRLYIPTRYPNGFPAGAPGEFFMESDAIQAMDDAQRILDFARERLGL